MGSGPQSSSAFSSTTGMRSLRVDDDNDDEKGKSESSSRRGGMGDKERSDSRRSVIEEAIDQQYQQRRLRRQQQQQQQQQEQDEQQNYNEEEGDGRNGYHHRPRYSDEEEGEADCYYASSSSYDTPSSYGHKAFDEYSEETGGSREEGVGVLVLEDLGEYAARYDERGSGRGDDGNDAMDDRPRGTGRRQEEMERQKTPHRRLHHIASQDNISIDSSGYGSHSRSNSLSNSLSNANESIRSLRSQASWESMSKQARQILGDVMSSIKGSGTTGGDNGSDVVGDSDGGRRGTGELRDDEAMKSRRADSHEQSAAEVAAAIAAGAAAGRRTYGNGQTDKVAYNDEESGQVSRSLGGQAMNNNSVSGKPLWFFFLIWNFSRSKICTMYA